MQKNKFEKIIVSPDNKGQRLDVFLASQIEFSRQKIQNWIKNNYVLINDKIAKSKNIVNEGDVVKFYILKEKEITLIKQEMPLDIVYEDDDVIVINKSNNIVVYPGIGHPDNTLINGVYYHCDKLSNLGGELRPGVVHRIDKKTTGLIVFAKTNIVFKNLVDQFAKKTAKRIYYAIVNGQLTHKKGIIDAPIGRSSNDRKKMTITNINGKKAITHFTVIKYFANHTLLKLELETGRTHQIRVHLKYINHPILGDEVYGLRKKSDVFGQYLHAKELEFFHPSFKKNIKLECELPQEFKNKIMLLEKEND